MKRWVTRRCNVAGRVGVALALGAFVAVVFGTVTPTAAARPPRAVYLLTNQATNRVVVYTRSGGTLTRSKSVRTGGRGIAKDLGSQYSMVMSDDGRFLYCVNPASGTITTFRVTATGLHRLAKVKSFGRRPVSLTLHKDMLYVLNAGGHGNVSGFTVRRNGTLKHLANSTRKLSNNGRGAAPKVGAVGFCALGLMMVVTEKDADKLVVWHVNGAHRLVRRSVHASPSATPFGLDFNTMGAMVIAQSQAGAALGSTLTSYDLKCKTFLGRSKNLALQETGATRLVIAGDTLAFVSNTASDAISSVLVGGKAEINLIASAAASTGAGSAPAELAVSQVGDFLFVVCPGNGTLQSFQISSGGAATPAGSVDGIPAGAAGLAAW